MSHSHTQRRARSRSVADWARQILFTVGMTMAFAAAASAQESLLDRMNLDRLQLAGLGVSVGHVDATQAVPATIFALTADYGEVAPGWRVVFGVSFWESRLGDDVVSAFLDTLKSSIDDPTDDYTIQASRISLFDVTFGGALRWSPISHTVLHPYFDAGLAAHVINAEGKLVKGTFVERSLDNIAAGVFAAAGLELHPVPWLGLDAQVRGDMLSGFRSTQIRLGGTYYLGPLRSVGP